MYIYIYLYYIKWGPLNWYFLVFAYICIYIYIYIYIPNGLDWSPESIIAIIGGCDSDVSWLCNFGLPFWEPLFLDSFWASILGVFRGKFLGLHFGTTIVKTDFGLPFWEPLFLDSVWASILRCFFWTVFGRSFLESFWASILKATCLGQFLVFHFRNFFWKVLGVRFHFGSTVRFHFGTTMRFHFGTTMPFPFWEHCALSILGALCAFHFGSTVRFHFGSTVRFLPFWEPVFWESLLHKLT